METTQLLHRQLLDNIRDYIKTYASLKKGNTDEQRKVFSFVLQILVGGDNIDWSLPQSVQSVCEILGLGKTTVYAYRKAESTQYKTPKRQRRSDALDQKVWWPQAEAVMATFWERNCDESPDANDPAHKHDFTQTSNPRFDPLPNNPEVTKRNCVGHSCQIHAKWNAHGCDSAMYRLFLEQHGEEWGELISKQTLMDAKPWWVVTPQNE